MHANNQSALGQTAAMVAVSGYIAAGYGNDAHQMKDVSPMSPMESAINSNENALNELENCLGTLQSALSPVMRPVPPSTAGEGKLTGVAQPHSLVVDRLHGQRATLDRLICWVNEMRGRLET